MSTAFPRAAAPPHNQEGSGLMKAVIGLMVALGLVLATLPSTRAADGKLNVVAAENFYGDVARQIGGDDVAVASVMSNPDQDPHLFETTPSTVRQIAAAQVVILNGADYDPWMDKLLKASPRPIPVLVEPVLPQSTMSPAISASSCGPSFRSWYWNVVSRLPKPASVGLPGWLICDQVCPDRKSVV